MYPYKKKLHGIKLQNQSGRIDCHAMRLVCHKNLAHNKAKVSLTSRFICLILFFMFKPQPLLKRMIRFYIINEFDQQ